MNILSKFKEYKEYVRKTAEKLKEDYSMFPDERHEALVDYADIVLESYLICLKPKDCAKEIIKVMENSGVFDV